MHEYSVVTELVALLLRRLEGTAGTILSVRLKKGELRILSDTALVSAFEIVSQRTRLEGASLEIEEVKASLSCRACGYRGPAEYLRDEAFHFAIPVLSCPRCGETVEILSGRELLVDSVCVATEESPAESLPKDEEDRCRSSGDA